ncbi:fimbrial protein [Salinivibrio kushneri]|uniref:fimbrial protein n=1 Tax=Salinivibrio kushneri TaxID=1908198 RepID=UPI0013013EC6|nr:fimbrial protein [Salinivibrio kushneri]
MLYIKNYFLMLIGFTVVVSLVFSQSANANKVRLLGATTNQTCVIEVNGSSSNPVVLLPTVAIDKLLTPSSIAGETWFEFSLRDCIPSQARNVYVTRLIGEASTEGNLVNSNGSAKNVVLQLMASSGIPIDINDLASVELNVVPEQGNANISIGVRYLSEKGSATSGSIVSRIQYLVTYL